MKPTDIARIVSAAIQAMRKEEETDLEIIAWDMIPAETRIRYEAGVSFHLANPEATVADGHKNWLKLTMGVEGKTREEFDSLSMAEKRERVMFHAIVKACSLVQPEIKVVKIAAPPVQQQVQVSKLPVKYIGRRPQYRDGIYGTAITWKQNEVIMVEETAARKMIRHADVWVLAEDEFAKEVPDKPKGHDDETEESVQTAKDTVARMGRQAMLQYAKTNFAGVNIHPATKEETLRQKIYGLIDQFGVAK